MVVLLLVTTIIDMGVELDIVQKSGTWFSYGAERLGQGREKCRNFLKENPEMCDEIEEKIRNAMSELDDFDMDEAVELVESLEA